MEINPIPIPTFPFDDVFDVDKETQELLARLLQENFRDFRNFAQDVNLVVEDTSKGQVHSLQLQGNQNTIVDQISKFPPAPFRILEEKVYINELYSFRGGMDEYFIEELKKTQQRIRDTFRPEITDIYNEGTEFDKEKAIDDIIKYWKSIYKFCHQSNPTVQLHHHSSTATVSSRQKFADFLRLNTIELNEEVTRKNQDSFHERNEDDRSLKSDSETTEEQDDSTVKAKEDIVDEASCHYADVWVMEDFLKNHGTINVNLLNDTSKPIYNWPMERFPGLKVIDNWTELFHSFNSHDGDYQRWAVNRSFENKKKLQLNNTKPRKARDKVNGRSFTGHKEIEFDESVSNKVYFNPPPVPVAVQHPASWGIFNRNNFQQQFQKQKGKAFEFFHPAAVTSTILSPPSSTEQQLSNNSKQNNTHHPKDLCPIQLKITLLENELSYIATSNFSKLSSLSQDIDTEAILFRLKQRKRKLDEIYFRTIRYNEPKQCNRIIYPRISTNQRSPRSSFANPSNPSNGGLNSPSATSTPRYQTRQANGTSKWSNPLDPIDVTRTAQVGAIERRHLAHADFVSTLSVGDAVLLQVEDVQYSGTVVQIIREIQTPRHVLIQLNLPEDVKKPSTLFHWVAVEDGRIAPPPSRPVTASSETNSISSQGGREKIENGGVSANYKICLPNSDTSNSTIKGPDPRSTGKKEKVNVKPEVLADNNIQQQQQTPSATSKIIAGNSQILPAQVHTSHQSNVMTNTSIINSVQAANNLFKASLSMSANLPVSPEMKYIPTYVSPDRFEAIRTPPQPAHSTSSAKSVAAPHPQQSGLALYRPTVASFNGTASYNLNSTTKTAILPPNRTQNGSTSFSTPAAYVVQNGQQSFQQSQAVSTVSSGSQQQSRIPYGGPLTLSQIQKQPIDPRLAYANNGENKGARILPVSSMLAQQQLYQRQQAFHQPGLAIDPNDVGVQFPHSTTAGITVAIPSRVNPTAYTKLHNHTNGYAGLAPNLTNSNGGTYRIVPGGSLRMNNSSSPH